MASALPENRENLLRLVWAHEIIREDVLYISNSLFYDLRIV